MHHIGIDAFHFLEHIENLLQLLFFHIHGHAARNNQAAQEAIACNKLVELLQIFLHASAHADDGREAHAGANIAGVAHMVIQSFHLQSQSADEPSAIRHLGLAKLFHSLAEAQSVGHTASTANTLDDGHGL